MKVTRSYWLGLGSGFILSAMLTLLISPHGQAVISLERSPLSAVKQQATTQPLAGGAKQADQPSITTQSLVTTQYPVTTQSSVTTQSLVTPQSPVTTQSSVTTQPPVTTQPSVSQAQPPKNQNATQIEQNFTIPQGSKLVRIADLLLAQGFIQNKQTFLVSVHQMGVENQFRFGTFTLSRGLTPKEVIQRLLEK